MTTNNGFLRLTLGKCFKLDPLGKRLRGEICTQCLLGSALGDEAWREEGSSWAQGNVELRYTHSRSFSQSHQETWNLCGPSELSCPDTRNLTLVFSPSTIMGYSEEGVRTQGVDAFGPRALSCQLSVLPEPVGLNTSVMKKVNHTIHYSYLYLETLVSITRASIYLHKLHFHLISVAALSSIKHLCKLGQSKFTLLSLSFHIHSRGEPPKYPKFIYKNIMCLFLHV